MTVDEPDLPRLERWLPRHPHPGGELLLDGVLVTDSSLELASPAFAQLRNVVFERVKLSEASFMEARLESVEFIACELAGADFRRVELKGCSIRGSSLDGVVGVEYLKGLAMPWPDLLASTGALATALGIIVESD